jgi:hypothetical protein
MPRVAMVVVAIRILGEEVRNPADCKDALELRPVRDVLEAVSEAAEGGEEELPGVVEEARTALTSFGITQGAGTLRSTEPSDLRASALLPRKL